jgi:tetratricopeptide (TPR) repeat protein
MYFSAAYGIMDDSNQEIITKQAKDTYQRQSKKDDKELNVILTYVLFGEENFKSAEKYSKKATKLFSNNEFDKAAKNYQNAIKMIPINPDHYYNRMAALYKLNNHLEIEETFKSLPDSINPRNGQFEFLMARSYLNIKDTLKACEFFNTSKNYNYAKSTSYLKNLCLK